MAGIVICHSQYAILQETLLGDKTLNLNVSMVLMFQHAIAIVVSGIIIVASGQPGGLFQGFTFDDLIVSFFNFGSMNFSNRAMKVVSYPFVILCKSAKIIPVILVGTLRGVYEPSSRQFLIALFITVGLLVFNAGKMKSIEGELTGISLVLGSLLFDGMTQTQTDKQHKSSKRETAYPTMFTNNVFGLIMSALIYMYDVHTTGDDTHQRLLADRSLLLSCVAIGVCGCFGQVFVFFTVSLFDCYFLTIITTTRKFFSVVYSNYMFGHNFNNIQWLGASIVMACTTSELFGDKKKDKKKI